jgi:Condensation domain/Phosphopantetheine attachment site
VIELTAIPLLPNGKINRKALPKPEVDVLAGGAERLAPRNPLEQQLLTAMEQILNLPGLGVRDNFFAMGGHSLLAAKLTSRLNKELDLGLPLRTVFESSTVEALALAVGKARGLNAPRRKAITRQADQSVAPLTVMQERIRFMEEMQPGRVLYNTPSAHRLTGPMDVVAFGCAFAQMLQRQPSLRSVIAPDTDGSGHLLRVLDQIDASIPFEDLSMLGEAEREAEVLLRMQAIIDQPINIMQAPLFRVALYKMASDQHIFLFMPHHIIWDGWSFDLLYQEMSTLYPAALENRSPTLPMPPVSYVDFAHWHDEWMRGDECRAQLQFWKQRYANIETPRSMPTDRPRSAGMTGTGATEWVHVDKTLTEQLREVALQHNATLNMLVMAVYAVMMSQVLGGSSLVMGVPVRGRLSGEVESVMGFFNNLLPAHLDVDPARTLGEWILAVKRELMDSFANQEVPFERLAAEPEIARHANKAGLYQSLFSFQDARERERSWGSLKHQSVLVMQKGATEDFGLWLMEVPTGLEGGINYNADLFDAPTAQLFHERLVALLQRVAATPNITLQALMVAPGEDASRLAAWVSARHAARDKADAARSAAKENEPPKVDTQPPQTGVEKLLAGIWCNLLNIPGVSCTDNFFDLGGHSLLAMQAIAAMESKTGKHIEPNRYIFETLGQIARWYDTAKPENGKKQPSRLRRALSRLVGT